MTTGRERAVDSLVAAAFVALSLSLSMASAEYRRQMLLFGLVGLVHILPLYFRRARPDRVSPTSASVGAWLVLTVVFVAIGAALVGLCRDVA